MTRTSDQVRTLQARRPSRHGYLVPRRNVGLHIESAAWIYQWDRYGFDRTQLDLTVSGGVSYRFRRR